MYGLQTNTETQCFAVWGLLHVKIAKNCKGVGLHFKNIHVLK